MLLTFLHIESINIALESVFRDNYYDFCTGNSEGPYCNIIMLLQFFFTDRFQGLRIAYNLDSNYSWTGMPWTALFVLQRDGRSDGCLARQ